MVIHFQQIPSAFSLRTEHGGRFVLRASDWLDVKTPYHPLVKFLQCLLLARTHYATVMTADEEELWRIIIERQV